LAADQLDQLGDFDDGGGGNDCYAEGFGDGEVEAVRLGKDVEVEQEGGVADVAEEGEGEVVERSGEVVGYWDEDGFERVDEGVLEGVHVEGGLSDGGVEAMRVEGSGRGVDEGSRSIASLRRNRVVLCNINNYMRQVTVT